MLLKLLLDYDLRALHLLEHGVKLTMNQPAKAQFEATELIDLVRYPINDLNSVSGSQFLSRCREHLHQNWTLSAAWVHEARNSR